MNWGWPWSTFESCRSKCRNRNAVITHLKTKKQNFRSNFVTVRNMGLKLCLVKGVFNARYYFMQYNCGSCYTDRPKQLSFDTAVSVERPRNPLSIVSFGGCLEVNVLNLSNDHEKRKLSQPRMKRCTFQDLLQPGINLWQVHIQCFGTKHDKDHQTAKELSWIFLRNIFKKSYFIVFSTCSCASVRT